MRHTMSLFLLSLAGLVAFYQLKKMEDFKSKSGVVRAFGEPQNGVAKETKNLGFDADIEKFSMEINHLDSNANRIAIALKGVKTQTIALSITDEHGKKMFATEQKLLADSTFAQVALNMNHYKTGKYIVEASTESESIYHIIEVR